MLNADQVKMFDSLTPGQNSELWRRMLRASQAGRRHANYIFNLGQRRGYTDELSAEFNSYLDMVNDVLDIQDILTGANSAY